MASSSQATDITASTPPADASPEKSFFIYVITKDIGLERAILDLVDNSVDAARRLKGVDLESDKTRPTKRYKGLRIELVVTPERFEIRDNCGGMDVEIAQRYAFKFGVPKDGEGPPRAPHSIGLFGIGMKRALFKLGMHFRVESVSAKTRFVIDQDVGEWQRKHDWDFPFDLAERFKTKPAEATRGTTVTVTSLHPTVQADFSRESWRNDLIRQLRDALQEPIAHGLEAKVNGTSVQADLPRLFQSDQIRPHVEVFHPEADPQVTVRLFVGVAEGVLDRAGWYVFCNDRLVLAADQTIITGWGAREPVRVPRYHNQYHRFRGYVYLDAADPSRLPWNTTKTGIDSDSPLWRGVRQRMIAAMKPVTTFLNAVRKEERGTRGTTTSQVRQRPLSRELAAAAEAKRDLTTLEERTDEEQAATFSWPDYVTPTADPKEILIKYTRPGRDVQRAMEFFDVSTAAEVGLRTFLYWKRAES